jgi:predicted lipid carrier protein YhbT
MHFFISRTTFVVPLILLSFLIALIANDVIKSYLFFGSFSHSAKRPTRFRSQLYTLLELNYCVCMWYYNFSIVTMKTEAVRFSETSAQSYYLSRCKNQ